MYPSPPRCRNQEKLFEKIKANVIESIQNTEIPIKTKSDNGRNHEDFNLSYKSHQDFQKSLVYEDPPQKRFYETQNFKSS
jgi:hypothetical protein